MRYSPILCKCGQNVRESVLANDEVRARYQTVLAESLDQTGQDRTRGVMSEEGISIETIWTGLGTSIEEAACVAIGKRPTQWHTDWFDEECTCVLATRHKAIPEEWKLGAICFLLHRKRG